MSDDDALIHGLRYTWLTYALPLHDVLASTCAARVRSYLAMSLLTGHRRLLRRTFSFHRDEEIPFA